MRNSHRGPGDLLGHAPQLTEHRSRLEDLDIVAAVGELSSQLATLQAAQQSYLRIQGLSLFDLLR